MSICCTNCGTVAKECCPQAIPTPHIPKLESLYCPQDCGGDESSYVVHRKYCKPKNKVERSNTLGAPVGVVRAVIPAKPELSGSELVMQKFAFQLKGFAHLILTPEIKWNNSVLTTIMKEGQKLFNESKKAEDLRNAQIENEDPEDVPTVKPTQTNPIYSATELKVIRSFELLGCLFDIELGQKSELNQFKKGIFKNVSVDNLLTALKAYFKEQNYCLVEINNLYALVWRTSISYFVLDFTGRYLDTFEISRDGGDAVLMCLRRIHNVYHLLAHLSGHNAKDICTLREMKVVKLVHPDGVVQSIGYEQRENEFVIVSPDYAYLASPLHLYFKAQQPMRTKSALPICVAAILASKIDHPATWTQNFLKKIFCYGLNVCIFCWERCLQNQNLSTDLNAFPNRFQLGQFLVRFTFKPKQYVGTYKCMPNYQGNELMQAISNHFERGLTKLLIQINNIQVYAVWKKNDFIYLLDPYRHALRIEKFDTERSASLRIFRSLNVFLFIFHQMLLRTNRRSEFYIHTLKIKKIELNKIGSDASREEDDGQGDGDELSSHEEDTLSLNETICFVDPDKRCLEELDQSDEDEPEDALEEEEYEESEPEHPGEEEGGHRGEAAEVPDEE